MTEETLFHLAREKAPGERAAFLDETCAGDPALRRRIETLLQMAATIVLCFYPGDLADRKALAYALLLCSLWAGQTVQWLRRRKQAGPLIMALRKTPVAIVLGPVLVLAVIGMIGSLVDRSAQTGDALVRVCSSITGLSVLAFLLLLVGVGVQLRKMGCLTFFRFVP